MRVTRWAVAAGALLLVAAPVAGQDLPPLPRPAAFVEAPDDGLLDAAELDTVLGRFALYPDPLLTQILVAATVPLDVVKADRWVAENADLPTDARSDAAATQGWDESVAVLAAGFPGVLQGMAADLDNTETLGDAVLAQTDDVLDSVQRLRAQAAATGYLESNEAQTVSVDETGEIAVAPADPEVVYVPSYDPNVAYMAAPTSPSYVTTDPIVTDPGLSGGDLLVSGAIAFGSAMLVNEIFDDDDDWDDYWGPGSIDWDDDEFYHRPGVDIEGDVNIDRDRVVIDRDRTDIGDRDAVRDRIGTVDPDRAREGSWKPDPARQADARAKLEQRQRTGGGDRAALDARLGDGDGGGAGAGALAAAGGAAIGGAAARDRLEKSAARRDVAPARKPTFDTALSPKRQGAPQAHRAQQRGASSLGAARAPQVDKPRPKSVSKASARRPAAQRPAPKKSAFKSSGGGQKARAASSRGHKSSARRSGGGGARRR